MEKTIKVKVLPFIALIASVIALSVTVTTFRWSNAYTRLDELVTRQNILMEQQNAVLEEFSLEIYSLRHDNTLLQRIIENQCQR